MKTSTKGSGKPVTTETEDSRDAIRLARKAIIARQLTDPLGRLGFRRTRDRLEREAGARRLLFVTALAAFAGTFGAIAFNAGTSDSTQSPAAPIVSSTSVDPVIRSNQRAVLNEPARRIVTPTPHVRTRSTP
jgi:hypothetical protein